MILGAIILLLVIPFIWATLVALAETMVAYSDHSLSKRLTAKFGRDIQIGDDPGTRVYEAFRQGFWSAFGLMLGLSIIGILIALVL